MTLIKLKDDSVEYVLPLFREEFTDTQYFDDYAIYGDSITEFSVLVEFETSDDFNFASSNPFSLSESLVGDVIDFLFSNTARFKDLTVEEFKAQLEYYLNHITR